MIRDTIGGRTDNDAAGVEVIVECFALTQKLGGKEQMQFTTIFVVETLAIAHAFSCAIGQCVKMIDGHVVEIIEKGMARA